MTAEELLGELEQSGIKELHIRKRMRSWEATARGRFGGKEAKGRDLPELIENLLS
jgi:hypothetical protein